MVRPGIEADRDEPGPGEQANGGATPIPGDCERRQPQREHG